MDSNLKLYMLFNDRVGIVADISSLIAGRAFNITSMEVERTDNKAKVYLEIETHRTAPDRVEIMQMLGQTPGLLEIRFIETLPQEAREDSFRVVLDNIRDGVISIDADGRITTINAVAKRVFNCEDRDVIGKDVRDLQLSDATILECLKGKKYNFKKDIINEKGRIQYMSICRPITDSADRITGAVEICKDMQEIKELAQSISKPSNYTFADFIGKSPAVREAILFARKIATTDSLVSIRGESGTGKELFAHAIHAASNRRGPFVAINCAALPETLLESELFGYSPGSFTGAQRGGKQGLFELAGEGTLFLDEIGEMPPGVQAKILRVIQEKCLRPIGGLREIPIHCRIITATHKNLELLVRENAFREDLYYRVDVFPILIPPLRERPEDIPPIAEHLLFQLGSKLEKGRQSLSDAAVEKLCGHSWRGNVRELKNVIERAAILCDSERIGPEYILFSFEVARSGQEPLPHTIPEIREGRTLHAMLDLYEQQIVAAQLERGGSVRKTAKALGISHTALLNKLKKHREAMERNRTTRQ